MKTTISIVVLVAVLVGGQFLYNNLKSTVKAPDAIDVQVTPSTTPEEASNTEDASKKETEEKKQQAPSFIVKDQKGDEVALSDLFGKPIVLNFWASWCPPCKSEMPEFNKVYKEYGDDVHFVMVDAVDGARETQEAGMAYIEKEGFEFPVYFDLTQEAVIAYGIRAFPTSIFINSDGTIAAGVEGAIDEATLRKGISLIMNQKTETTENTPTKAEYHKISPKEAKEQMDTTTSFTILDVRTPEEYEEKHIPGATLIPDYELLEKAPTELPDKDALIFVYCRSGNRSATASKELVALGYTNVYDFGGIQSWPYETKSNQ